MSTRSRIAAGLLALSATGLVAIVGNEGYSAKAIRPVAGDKPTYGLGSTTRPDGSPVHMGDTITPPAAIALAVREVSAKEGVLKACFTAPLYQYEYDAFVSLAYNVGPGAVCRSSIPAKLAAGRYAEACRTILDFKKVQGRDCSAPANAHFCGGLWQRRQGEFRSCLGPAQ